LPGMPELAQQVDAHPAVSHATFAGPGSTAGQVAIEPRSPTDHAVLAQPRQSCGWASVGSTRPAYGQPKDRFGCHGTTP
jgi:hypothetical protein